MNFPIVSQSQFLFVCLFLLLFKTCPQNDIGNRKTPTVIGYGEHQRYVADEALAQQPSNPNNTITHIKRYLGRSWTDVELKLETAYNCVNTVNQSKHTHTHTRARTHVHTQADKNTLTQILLPACFYLFVLAFFLFKKDGRVAFDVEYQSERRILNPEQVAATMLNRLRKIAEQGLSGQVHDCVIGCPVWFTEHQRRALLDAANVVGLNVLRLINETTAVALYYAMTRTEKKDEPRIVLFVDMGSASTQVSVVRFESSRLTVLASGGDRNLGGRNFDDLLVSHFGAYIQTRYGMDVLRNTKARHKLHKECVKVKHMLSTNAKVPFNVEYIMNVRLGGKGNKRTKNTKHKAQKNTNNVLFQTQSIHAFFFFFFLFCRIAMFLA